jgi:hypothetical protein
VAQAYNPSYSGGRDREDAQFKASLDKQFVRLYLKKPTRKNGWWSSSKYRP